MQFRETILLTSKNKNFDILTEFLAFEFRYSWNYLYINCTIFSILVHRVVRLPSIIISSYNYIFYFDFGRHSKTTQRHILGHFQTPFIDHFTLLSPKRCLLLFVYAPFYDSFQFRSFHLLILKNSITFFHILIDFFIFFKRLKHNIVVN